MIRRPPRATRTDTLVPYPTLFRSASLVRKHYEGDGADGERTVVGRIHDGEVALVVNTPHGTTSGGSPRLDGYEIRAAAIMTDRSEEHTSELQSLMRISYAVFCLTQKNKNNDTTESSKVEQAI